MTRTGGETGRAVESACGPQISDRERSAVHRVRGLKVLNAANLRLEVGALSLAAWPAAVLERLLG